jgi:phosphotransferase system enzyme I (PtsI)
MCSDPILALILIGLNLDEFSMSPLNLLQIKKLIRSVRFSDAQKLAEDVLQLSTGDEVEKFSRERLKELAPQVINSERE